MCDAFFVLHCRPFGNGCADYITEWVYADYLVPIVVSFLYHSLTLSLFSLSSPFKCGSQINAGPSVVFHLAMNLGVFECCIAL